MSVLVIMSLAQQVGKLIAAVSSAKGNPELANVVNATTTAATGILGALDAHVKANPSLGITAAELRVKINAAVLAALDTGDEAAARIVAREVIGE